MNIVRIVNEIVKIVNEWDSEWNPLNLSQPQSPKSPQSLIDYKVNGNKKYKFYKLKKKYKWKQKYNENTKNSIFWSKSSLIKIP